MSYAEEADAQKFIARFGGVMIAVEDRPRLPHRSRRLTQAPRTQRRR